MITHNFLRIHERVPRSLGVRKTALVPLVIAVALNVMNTGCGKKEKEVQSKAGYPLETAKMVSHVTSDVIESRSEITIRFVAPVAEKMLVGSVLQKTVFVFDPPIEGTAQWIDDRTLVFKPNRPLPPRKSYTGRLDMVELFPEHRKKQLQPLVFTFTVAGREIEYSDGDFELVDQNNPEVLVYRGKIRFTEATELETVRRSVTFRMNSTKLGLEWSAGTDEREFLFCTEAIKRERQEKRFVLHIDKDFLDLSGDYREEFVLEPIRELEVSRILTADSDDEPKIRVEFSDPLDADQDVTGLITVDGMPDIELRKKGKTVYISAPFSLDEKYTVRIHPGVRSRWGIRMEDTVTQEIEFADIDPQIRFSSEGVFLPSANEQKILCMSVNVKRIHLEILKVFESNLGQFMQTQQFTSTTGRGQDFYGYELKRVGVTVARDTLEIGERKNRWLQHELDLKRTIPPDFKGLFLLKLSFTRDDMLYQDKGQTRDRRRRDWYYSDPSSDGYLYAHGQIVKPVILSDIGITYKHAHQRHLVYATQIPDAAPLRGVRVTLRTYQNQIIAQKITDNSGKADFRNISEDVSYVEAEKDGQRSVIKKNEMSWNLSSFDVEGEELPPGGTRTFIYTERGVYRPGEEINISLIARNEDNTFPENHPVTIKIYDPHNKLVMEETQRTAVDGFYKFSFRSEPEAPTGNWQAVLHVGSRTFYHRLKIETVAPYRLKVVVEPEKTHLQWMDQQLRLALTATYLFGNPATGLSAEIETELLNVEKRFAEYPGFSFGNSAVEFKPIKLTVFKGKLDDSGRADVAWSLPPFMNAPSALLSAVNATVFDKGGRPNRSSTTIQIDPYDQYVGLQIPVLDYGYTQAGKTINIKAVLVDTEGIPLAGRQLHYRIYKNSRYWWWEYRNRNEFILKFKSDSSTELVTEGTLFSQSVPVTLQFSPDYHGEYLIEVQSPSEHGHTAAAFFSAYEWGKTPSDIKDAGTLTLKTDKDIYHPGDVAVVRFTAPEKASILMTVERGSHVLSSQWISPDHKSGEVEVEIPISDAMLPTSYVTVSIIQPHIQTANDRPMRMFGIVPLRVEDPQSHLDVTIGVAHELRSNETFDVTIQTADMQPAQFTVAVVDEGLLDLTRFQTPDPWREFNKKLRLGVTTFDLFSHVIGVNRGDIFQTFSIGGDQLMEAYRESQLDAERVRRFKPVSLFRGPLATDSKGRAALRFTMPDYIGSVKVMVVAADRGRYGCAETAVPVKTELMVLPTLPRVLGPTDSIAVPVTVFAMTDDISDVTVSIETTGPLSVHGDQTRRLTFTEPGERDVQFAVVADSAIGAGRITVRAASGSFKATSVTDISIRPSSPRIYETAEESCEPGGSIAVTIPDRGVQGSNNAVISVLRKPKLNLQQRLRWLIHYPYGCIEQTVSSAFPQLYLKEFIRKNETDEEIIDENINAAVRRLRLFQLPSGAFAYWPGGSDVSIWGTSYAGHFLVEAKKLGYNVPPDLLGGWLRFEKSRSLTTLDNLLSRIYRVYLLALCGDAQIGPMNLLRENSLKDMDDAQKWLLAAAYRLAGVSKTANAIAEKAGFDVRDYNELSGTYGSGLRDKAIILDVLTLFELWPQADVLYGDITDHLSTEDWYSTQTTGYALLALGKYIQANVAEFGGENPVLAGHMTLPSGERIHFETDGITYSVHIAEGFGEKVEVHIDEKTTLKRAYILLEWDGIPLLPDVKETSKRIALDVEWIDEDGMPIDPSSIRQGSTFWGHFFAEKSPDQQLTLEEMALVQVLPAGWEIENIRLSGEQLPQWMRRWELHREEYVDIRDDRIMWFFDMPRNTRSLDFVVKLNAVTVGSFILPPAIFEAMYDNNYKAVSGGQRVTVE